jgi:hypothetical protein
MPVCQIDAGKYCGFGYEGGLFPELRAGWLRLTFAKPTFADQVRDDNSALREARQMLTVAQRHIVRVNTRNYELERENEQLVLDLGRVSAQNAHLAAQVAERNVAVRILEQRIASLPRMVRGPRGRWVKGVA